MGTQDREPKRRPTRFCGIDVGSRRHVACIIDRDGRLILRSQAFLNNAEGYQRILACLANAGGPECVLVGMEATGHYWYALHDALTRAGYEVAVINPLQTSQQAKKGIRKRKTDKVDARHIATLIKNDDHRPAIVPDEFAMTCRQLTRLRYGLIQQSSRIKVRLWATMDAVWPEYKALFSDPLGKTGHALLRMAPTPGDLLKIDLDRLVQLIHKTSQGRFGPDRARRIRQAAEQSVGMKRGLGGARIVVQSLLTQLNALDPIRRRLETKITTLARRLPCYVLTLPGAVPLRAVSLFGEIDPIEVFTRPDQLVAFAGLDPSVFQTGNSGTIRRRISKRGSPYLRRTLWLMAVHAIKQEGPLRDYWQRRRNSGAHHFIAVTATAAKICHIAWRIMSDRRDYIPDQPPES